MYFTKYLSVELLMQRVGEAFPSMH